MLVLLYSFMTDVKNGVCLEKNELDVDFFSNIESLKKIKSDFQGYDLYWTKGTGGQILMKKGKKFYKTGISLVEKKIISFDHFAFLFQESCSLLVLTYISNIQNDEEFEKNKGTKVVEFYTLYNDVLYLVSQKNMIKDITSNRFISNSYIRFYKKSALLESDLFTFGCYNSGYTGYYFQLKNNTLEEFDFETLSINEIHIYYIEHAGRIEVFDIRSNEECNSLEVTIYSNKFYSNKLELILAVESIEKKKNKKS